MPEKYVDGYSSRIPEDIRQGLAKYRDNENFSTRNEVFQTFRKKNEGLADSLAGQQDFQGYQGMLDTFNKLYHVGETGKHLEAADMINQLGSKGKQGLIPNSEVVNQSGSGEQPNTGNMPGNNTNSTLAILHRRQ